ncbi:serine/threonine-protein kinase 19 [Poecile atricapillus]|uniref:serine/threonine-protein kinase 19 n=1 Tax=Poecile atricapillus TaxID=48891 RepID=UPI0027388408|nr:serine/threonine-protein kinase 19 [Poecile atricapillus]
MSRRRRLGTAPEPSGPNGAGRSCRERNREPTGCSGGPGGVPVGGPGGPMVVPVVPGSPAEVEAALGAVAELFPRRLFGDALPPLVLRHQLYALVRDRTAVDRTGSVTRAGFGSCTWGWAPTRWAWSAWSCTGRRPWQRWPGPPGRGWSGAFWTWPWPGPPELSLEQPRMRELGFGDRDVTALVAAGLLTVRDAGSWWLAVPGAGRFLRALLRGRRALLSLVRRSRHREVPLRELQGGKTPPGAGLGVPFLLHDLLGDQKLLSVPTAAGPLLRLADS